MTKRYQVSEWGHYGGGDIYSTDDLQEAKDMVLSLLKGDRLFYTYSIYDSQKDEFIND